MPHREVVWWLVTTIERAHILAEQLVKPLGRRWSHVQAVADRARVLALCVSPGDRQCLVAAAWLHDVGYSPAAKVTGFHPVDGARYLRGRGWPERIVNLVAHHSGARFEAAERGLSKEMSDFPFEDSPVMDALVTADLTVGPNGEQLTYDERIAEILKRYSADDPVHRTWVKAAPILKECVVRTQERLAQAQPR